MAVHSLVTDAWGYTAWAANLVNTEHAACS
jgi:hypothetical protein